MKPQKIYELIEEESCFNSDMLSPLPNKVQHDTNTIDLNIPKLNLNQAIKIQEINAKKSTISYE